MNADSTLEPLRDAIVARLKSFYDFDGVSVLSISTGDVNNAIQMQLGMIGVVIFVSIPQFVPTPHQSARVLLDPVSIVIEIIEDVFLNQSADGTGKGALFLAERVCAAMQQWQPPGEGTYAIMPDSQGIVEEGATDPEKTKIYYLLKCHFTTKAIIKPTTP